ncbi:MAG: hypothetical protein JOS17DRAFT_427488 [Linnemannia elongata]|nr:MAG: hypothetical protein JOS17DRAFT_427488 [Linnemannia elongata]
MALSQKRSCALHLSHSYFSTTKTELIHPLLPSYTSPLLPPPLSLPHNTTTATMFTGIVEILGKVTSIVPLDSSESGGEGFSITIGNAAEILGDCHLGDSIAVNGKLTTHNCHYYFLA